MADVIKKAVNKFTKGLVMDFSPENTQNELLTHALNATLLTFNGNELSLQNDMGNARVETAFLPEGYMPVGTCEYGGIIYIVSYNPIEDKSQIGCFPSPERNISNKELGSFTNVKIKSSDFQEYVNNQLTGNLLSPTKYILLKEDNLNPGDKFLICANDTIYQERLADLTMGSDIVKNPMIALNVVSIEDSGKIVYLNSDLRKYEVNKNGATYNYHIIGEMNQTSNITQENIDIDAYRNVLSSGYNVFKSKTSGKLAILAELITIDSYAVTHSLQPTCDEHGNILKGEFDIVIHSEIEPKLTKENYITAPKLAYYYLDKSQGYLQVSEEASKQLELFHNNIVNREFLSTSLSSVFVPTDSNDTETQEALEITLGESGQFDFNQADTYHAKYINGKMADFIPQNEDDRQYPDIKLAHIKIPEVLFENGLDLPFKYDYTIVPCMTYGKLDHLAVSNTVDFSKLHNFNKSTFTTWKYHLDGNQLRLTFGAEIFDTYETNKVDALVLEFYDCWGFAGSLTLADKKSYSGIFTKIISLNTLRELNQTRVGSTSTFKRNIGLIKELDGTITFKNEPVELTEDGWKYINSGEYLSDQDNDCGGLYPNMIYGVKTYLRRSIPQKNGEVKHEYIRKQDKFLYTLPVYNEYYYTTDDFSTLINPQLHFVLTYRLEDSSTKSPHTGNNVVNGYGVEDTLFMKDYLQGNLKDEDTADTYVVKYYKYSGVSKLNLEVGLQKEYQDMCLSYDQNLNSMFNCKLQLMSNDVPNNPFSVISKVANYQEALQYDHKSVMLNIDVNKINSPEISGNVITGSKFITYNFINTPSIASYIPINYTFVVGYKALITNIRKTKVPATTVCALFHLNDNDEYNYEDFGIYQHVDQSTNDISYLSNAAFYNEGSKSSSIFGICKQLKAQKNGDIASHWQSIDSIETEAAKITTPLRFNTGKPLQYLTPHIGKYAFCQPYVPTISDQYYTNLDVINESELSLDTTINSEYKEYPRYSLVLNTYSSIILASEFISTIPFYISNGKRKYSTFTGTDIASFNKALLETMKNVYTYNPDYDYLEVHTGDVTVIDNDVQFVSNLVNTYSEFVLPSNTTLNNYIYLGTMKVSDYLTSLETYSDERDFGKLVIHKDNKPLDQVVFVPNYLYCGTPESPYLISTLTYKTPKPSELESEISLETLSGIVVRHSDGSINMVSGSLSKNALYGYSAKHNNLIQLDVANYTIAESGNLSLKDQANLVDTESSFYIFAPGESTKIVQDVVFTNLDGTQASVPVTLSFSRSKMYMGHLIAMTEHLTVTGGTRNDEVIISLSVNAPSGYAVELLNIETGDTYCKLLNGDSWGMSKDLLPDINAHKAENLYKIATQETGQVTLKTNAFAGDGTLPIDGTSFQPGTLQPGSDRTFDISKISSPVSMSKFIGTNYIMAWLPSYHSAIGGVLYDIELKRVTIRLRKIQDLTEHTNSIVNCVKTNNYANLLGNKYSVKQEYSGAQLRGTSLTLNDLYYDPSNLQHRLFVREGLVSNDTTLPNKLCFRKDTGTLDDLDMNSISLQTGPCFTAFYE